MQTVAATAAAVTPACRRGGLGVDRAERSRRKLGVRVSGSGRSRGARPALRSTATRAAASSGKTVSAAESLGLPRPAAWKPAGDPAAPAAEAPPTFERVKSLGRAGIVAYVGVELAFWAVAAPLAAALAGAAQDAEGGAGALVAGGVVFLNAVRLFTPLKIAAAVVLAPSVEAVLGRTSSEAAVAALKAQIRELAGAPGRNGTSVPEAARAEVAAAVAALAAASPDPRPSRADLRGSSWALLYTDSKGSSSGRLGPLVGRVTQEFSPDGPSYTNVVALGPLSARLEASFAAAGDRALAVQFESLGLRLGGVQLLRKPFPDPKPRGTWELLFSDGQWRVLRIAETGNVFVLERIEIEEA